MPKRSRPQRRAYFRTGGFFRWRFGRPALMVASARNSAQNQIAYKVEVEYTETTA
jgi:hypothetical protein